MISNWTFECGSLCSSPTSVFVSEQLSTIDNTVDLEAFQTGLTNLF
jgi:hypothetical protein